LTAKQVIAYSKADSKKYSDGEGLYFCVRKQGSPYWMIRYTTAKGRREATLGQFPLMSLAWSPVKTGCSAKRKFTTPSACFIPPINSFGRAPGRKKTATQ